ncbi:MAG: class I tRNA ligase family protein, partial [Clostridia bacterium]
AQKIYDFAWNEFCDWYIELSKGRLMGEDEALKRNVRAVLTYVLEGLLKLLHPFMPYLTEEVYQHLPQSEGMLILASWPQVKPEYAFAAEERQMEGLMEIIRTIRNLRAEMNVQAGKRIHVTLIPEAGWAEALALAEPYLQRLAGVSDAKLGGKDALAGEKVVSAVCSAGELRIPLGDLVDFDKELARLEKERKNLEG